MKKDDDHSDVIWTGSGVNKQDIRLVRVDDIVKEPVHFMKLDCQGFELYALQGAERMLKKYKPVLYLEFAPFLLRKADVQPISLLEYLDSLGYTIWKNEMKSKLSKNEFQKWVNTFSAKDAQDLVAIRSD